MTDRSEIMVYIFPKDNKSKWGTPENGFTRLFGSKTGVEYVADVPNNLIDSNRRTIESLVAKMVDSCNESLLEVNYIKFGYNPKQK